MVLHPLGPAGVARAIEIGDADVRACARIGPLRAGPAELDSRYLSKEIVGGFTGCVIGVDAAEGNVAFDWFEYRRDGAPFS